MTDSMQQDHTDEDKIIFASPNKHQIIGTLETVRGVALASFERQPDGQPTYEYEGETKIWWDEQKTVKKKGKTIFICEAGFEWTQDQCIWISEAELNDGSSQISARPQPLPPAP